jgi:DNA-binding response OmpR family regulator
VLVVEDDESTALFVTRVLSRNGFDAAWVMDAEQATERLGSECFDVLLADYRLPGQSGMELARATRRSQPDIGIAVMTSFAETGTEEEVRTIGADDFFEKPLHSSTLVTRIRDLVSRSRGVRNRVPVTPPARGALEATPAEPAPEVSPSGEASGPRNVAESGSEARATAREAARAWLGFEVAEDALHPWREDTEDARRTRFSALPEGPLVPESGCEGLSEANPREEADRHQRYLLARASHPAISYLLARRLVAQRLVAQRSVAQPILVWASGAPMVSISSRVSTVTDGRSGPDWLLSS